MALCVYTNLSGMVLIDAGGCIVDCNSIFSQLALGYSRAALIGTVSAAPSSWDSTANKKKGRSPDLLLSGLVCP